MENKKILNLLELVYNKFPEASSEYLNYEILDFNTYGFSIGVVEVQEWLEEYQKNLDELDYTEEEFIFKKVDELLTFYKEVVAELQKNGLPISKFQNLDNFVEWLQGHSKIQVDSGYVVMSILELVSKYETTCFSVYELDGCERLNQSSFAFSYDVEPAELDDDDELIKDEVFIF